MQRPKSALSVGLPRSKIIKSAFRSFFLAANSNNRDLPLPPIPVSPHAMALPEFPLPGNTTSQSVPLRRTSSMFSVGNSAFDDLRRNRSIQLAGSRTVLGKSRDTDLERFSYSEPSIQRAHTRRNRISGLDNEDDEDDEDDEDCSDDKTAQVREDEDEYDSDQDMDSDCNEYGSAGVYLETVIFEDPVVADFEGDDTYMADSTTELTDYDSQKFDNYSDTEDDDEYDDGEYDEEAEIVVERFDAAHHRDSFAETVSFHTVHRLSMLLVIAPPKHDSTLTAAAAFAIPDAVVKQDEGQVVLTTGHRNLLGTYLNIIEEISDLVPEQELAPTRSPQFAPYEEQQSINNDIGSKSVNNLQRLLDEMAEDVYRPRSSVYTAKHTSIFLKQFVAEEERDEHEPELYENKENCETILEREAALPAIPGDEQSSESILQLLDHSIIMQEKLLKVPKKTAVSEVQLQPPKSISFQQRHLNNIVILTPPPRRTFKTVVQKFRKFKKGIITRTSINRTNSLTVCGNSLPSFPVPAVSQGSVLPIRVSASNTANAVTDAVSKIVPDNWSSDLLTDVLDTLNQIHQQPAIADIQSNGSKQPENNNGSGSSEEKYDTQLAVYHDYFLATAHERDALRRTRKLSDMKIAYQITKKISGYYSCTYNNGQRKNSENRYSWIDLKVVEERSAGSGGSSISLQQNHPKRSRVIITSRSLY
ncbi:hypothetical protein HK100_009071 [Physocladia obscura]|uniref:Uncharacterized protein n=1 Tax=Physocladia obscura TaxID=109957 RepID=A0AAD5SNN1_9FUNG|nr:hypothetical protein HK100_009071 [Physocladia obscura]